MRSVFCSSQREEVRRGAVYNLIEQEVVRALRSDDELVRLNNEAREHSLRERDETAVQEMQREVARLLRIYGINLAEAVGSEAGGRELANFVLRAHTRLVHHRYQLNCTTLQHTFDFVGRMVSRFGFILNRDVSSELRQTQIASTIIQTTQQPRKLTSSSRAPCEALRIDAIAGREDACDL